MGRPAGAVGLDSSSCEWQPTPVLCLENPMDRSLVGYSPWGRKESDTTDAT